MGIRRVSRNRKLSDFRFNVKNIINPYTRFTVTVAFTSTQNWVCPEGVSAVDYLVVAGGGGGGNGDSSGQNVGGRGGNGGSGIVILKFY